MLAFARVAGPSSGAPVGVTANAPERFGMAVVRRRLHADEPIGITIHNSSWPIARYTRDMATPRSIDEHEAARRREQAERAARIAAMLDRWHAEDVSDEPEWEVDQIPHADLSSSVRSRTSR